MPASFGQSAPIFKVGDKAVYPGQGVGEVMGIEHKEVAGQRQSFYVLRILENGMKIMIPMNKVGSVGLREIIGEKEVRRVYSILREKEVSVDSTTWNRRYREYMEKIKTGSVFEIAEVLRDLYLLKGDKDLSFGERKMLDTARSLLIKDSNKLVNSAVVKNPRITEPEILTIAKSVIQNEEILRIICQNKEWIKNPSIRKALVLNNKTPLPVAIRFMGFLTEKDLLGMAKSRNISSVLANNARRMVSNKKKS